MRWNTFLQIILFFVFLVFSIVLFGLLNLDVSFITTFIVTIFTLSISIFFFMESSKISNIIKEKLLIIKEGVDEIKWQDREKVKDLNISDNLKYGSRKFKK